VTVAEAKVKARRGLGFDLIDRLRRLLRNEVSGITGREFTRVEGVIF
jgi:hypothetical protein